MFLTTPIAAPSGVSEGQIYPVEAIDYSDSDKISDNLENPNLYFVDNTIEYIENGQNVAFQQH